MMIEGLGRVVVAFPAVQFGFELPGIICTHFIHPVVEGNGGTFEGGSLSEAEVWPLHFFVLGFLFFGCCHL